MKTRIWSLNLIFASFFLAGLIVLYFSLAFTGTNDISSSPKWHTPFLLGFFFGAAILTYGLKYLAAKNNRVKMAILLAVTAPCLIIVAVVNVLLSQNANNNTGMILYAVLAVLVALSVGLMPTGSDLKQNFTNKRTQLNNSIPSSKLTRSRG